MKRLTHIAVATFILAGTAIAQENIATTPPSTDVAGTLQYFMPGQDDDYDSGFGAEIQIRFWSCPNLGFALAGGVASWEVNEQEGVADYGSSAFAASIEGDVTLVPIGGSILYRAALADNLNLVLEGGLRYVIVESDATMTFALTEAYGGVVGGSADMKIDNGFVGLVAANLEAELSPGVSLLGGVGYQFDITKGDVEWMGEDFGENELKAFFIRAGLAFDF
ncbi:MAG: hypothetical protein ACOX9C_08035 [Kiritimatiellia bacterium]|jgi:hypothetical protein